MAQVSRLEKKLENCFVNKEYYEAHQIYRTIYYRLSASGKFDELLRLLRTGTLRLAEANELGSAYDLAEVLAETLLKSQTPPTKETLNVVEEVGTSSHLQLYRKLPSQLEDGQQPSCDRRTKYVSTTIKWSQAVAVSSWEKHRGSAELHRRFAVALSQEGQLDNARSHFLLSNDPKMFASFLAEWHMKGGEDVDVDRWITFTILQITYFSTLIASFHPEISVDPSYKEYLDKIGQIYFGMAPKGSGGLLGSLIKGLMGSDESEREKEFVMDEDGDNLYMVPNSSEQPNLYQREMGVLIKADQQPTMQHDDDLD